MFIVFGSPRSGTTLLASTLELHDDIVVPRETDFIVPLAFIVDRVRNEAVGKQFISQIIPATNYFPVSLGKFLTKADVEQAIASARYDAASLVEAIYARLAEKAGKKLAGDKSPNDLQHIGIFMKTGMLRAPQIKIIHVVRDVRDVVLSLEKVDWAGPEAARAFPRLWAAENLVLWSAFGPAAPNYLLVKFEEMVAEPPRHFQRMTQFLGVPFQERMLDHTRRGMAYRNQSHHQNIKEPFLASRAGAWRTEMSDELRQRCESHAGQAMEVFGYR